MKKVILIILIFCSQNLLAEPTWYPLPKQAYQFGQQYPEAQRLLFAFDYGHALVYERLLQTKQTPLDPKIFEQKILEEVFAILKNPPFVKSDEADIAPQYVYTFPLTVNLFDWSHLLHQFVLDVMSSDISRGPEMTIEVNKLFEKYRSQKNIAITEICKTMLFMDGHFFSKEFRRTYPRFNLLIWSYHWFQIRLYESLMHETKIDRDREVAKTVEEFWKLVSDLPDSAEFDMMPSVKESAPFFYKRFPLISASFDNNHMLHDIVSDILVSKKVTISEMKSVGITYSKLAIDPEAFKSNLCNK